MAVTCFDPDAPTASGFWHWAAFNIPADVAELPTNAGAAENLGIDGVTSLTNDSGERTHFGAQPPEGHGPHRYLYAVHAVDTEELDIPADATPTVLGFNLHFHAIGRAILWGWQRKTLLRKTLTPLNAKLRCRWLCGLAALFLRLR